MEKKGINMVDLNDYDNPICEKLFEMHYQQLAKHEKFTTFKLGYNSI